MRFISIVVATAAIALCVSSARAEQPAPAASPAQTRIQKSASAKKKAAPLTTPANKQAEQKLSPIVVTATRIPQPIADIGTTITVVEDPQIQEQKIDRVEHVLREVPGVQVTQSGSPGSETDVSIRGATASQTLVLIDGVEVNAGATGSFDLANLTTDNLDRVEILRGAGGSLYGSQAIGGVVNVLSQEGEGPADGEHCCQRAAIARPAIRSGPSAAPREISATRVRCRTSRPRATARSTTTPTTSRSTGGSTTTSATTPSCAASRATSRRT